MTQQQDNYKASQENATKIERELDVLKSGHQGFLNRRYKEFWEHVKQIHELFKTLKPLHREDRERLWVSRGIGILK
jgi:hypothetical protein